MQSLAAYATGGYTEAQLTERLTSPSAAIGCRFDILDSSLNVLTTLGEIDAPEASVAFDNSRDVVGSLGMTMLPNQAINTPYLYRIKPWFRLRMLDGGIAEWPMGVYVWNVPSRRDVGKPEEEWDVTLGDQTDILHLAGPGPDGLKIAKGTVVTEAIVHILGTFLGVTDFSGITQLGTKVTSDLHWGMTSRTAQQIKTEFVHEMKIYQLEMVAWQRATKAWYKAKEARDKRHAADAAAYHKAMNHYEAVMAARRAVEHAAHAHHRKVHLPPPPKHPVEHREPPLPRRPKRPKRPIRPPKFAGTFGTTWYDVLAKLHTLVGFMPPWYDLTGRYRAVPQVDLANAQPAKTYYDGKGGVMLSPLNTNEDLQHIANRVIARCHTVGGYYDIGTADLNTVSPGHPLSQQSLGFYIDVCIEDTVSDSITGLNASALAELHRRMATYQTVDMSTLAWPVHELNDVLGVVYSTDYEMGGSGIVCLETQWEMDLVRGTMVHALSRVK